MISNVTRVDQLQMKIISSLRDHCTYNSQAQKKTNYFSKLLSTLTELRTLSVEGMTRMIRLNEVVSMTEELTSQVFTPSSCEMMQSRQHHQSEGVPTTSAEASSLQEQEFC
jgi:hypothetical protein